MYGNILQQKKVHRMLYLQQKMQLASSTIHPVRIGPMTRGQKFQQQDPSMNLAIKYGFDAPLS